MRLGLRSLLDKIVLFYVVSCTIINTQCEMCLPCIENSMARLYVPMLIQIPFEICVSCLTLFFSHFGICAKPVGHTQGTYVL